MALTTRGMSTTRLLKWDATPVILPQRNAEIKHGNCSGPPLPRDEAIRYIRAHGRNKWKRARSYHRRSLAETAVYRFKQLMGRFVEARRWERKGRGKAQGQSPEPNGPTGHAGNEENRRLNEESQNGLCYGVRHVRVTGRLLPPEENITSVAPNSIWSLSDDGRSLPVQSDGSQIKFGTTT